MHDRGGRRSGNGRRRVVIPGYEPERRSGQDRRSGQERRSPEHPEELDHLRRNMDRYAEFSNANRGFTYGILFSLMIWAVIILVIVRKVWY
jgi:hypothetical protein